VGARNRFGRRSGGRCRRGSRAFARVRGLFVDVVRLGPHLALIIDLSSNAPSLMSR
jgi:hypothetical protein